MRVLVTYGSKHGGTGGLARAIGEGLVVAGHRVDVLPADKVDALDSWGAVVMGGACLAVQRLPIFPTEESKAAWGIQLVILMGVGAMVYVTLCSLMGIEVLKHLMPKRLAKTCKE